MLKLYYGHSVVTVPAAALQQSGASALDFRVLLAIAAKGGEETDASALAGALGEDAAAVTASLAFWRGAGLLVAKDSKSAAGAARAAVGKKPMPDRGLPGYNAEDLARIVETRKDFNAFVGACQQTMGKVFNTAEITILAGMMDYLALESDYILLLLAHCVRMEKKSLRYAEKMALSLYDSGITDTAALEEYLRRIETMAGATGKIRTLFGLGTRALSTKEKSMVEKWVCVMKYDMDVLTLAYECTVDATGDASMAYANSILERWYGAGYRTAGEVKKALEEYRRQKAGGSSFDADDFFRAALKNTYGE